MKKPFATILYSTLGVAALFLVLVAFNYLAGKFHRRIDLTAEKAFTLSPGTRAILGKLDTPVKIRFYCTRNESMPVQMKPYVRVVEDLLDEYRQASKGFVQIQKLDPEPDSDAEDSAKLDGVDSVQIPNGDQLYLGLSVSMLDQKAVVPFLSPDREPLLEYDITSAISRVTTTNKPVVGVMSALPVAGHQVQSMMMMQQQDQGEPAWVLYDELEHDFTMKRVEINAEKIPDDVNVLLVIHPRDISLAGQYAIDQFVLRGGRLIAFLDPSAVLDTPPGGGFMPQSSNSNLPDLLRAWGITFDASQVLIDKDYMPSTQRGPVPGFLVLNGDALSKDDLVTADVPDLLMVFAGAFSGTPAAGLKETVLVKSSTDAQFANPMIAETSPKEALNGFVPANKEFPLAIRLTGKFKTAFPGGPPKGDDAKKDDDKKTPPAPAGLKESTGENTVILVGDTDMLQDRFAVDNQENPMGGRMVVAVNGNLAFAENAVEQLSGDSNLISIRSRTARERPFTVVRKLQESAEAASRDKYNELQKIQSETEQKMNELQQHRTDPNAKNPQQFILSPEQQAELQKYKQKRAANDKEMRIVKRNLNAQTQSLGNRIKWLNITLMPALVALAGVAIALIKRRRSAAT